MTSGPDSDKPTTPTPPGPAGSARTAGTGSSAAPSTGTAGQRARATPFTGAASFGARAFELYRDYQAALVHAEREAVRRHQEACATHTKAVRAVRRESVAPARAAYVDYATAVQRAQVDPQAAPAGDVYRAQASYQDAYQRAADATQEAIAAANRSYAEDARTIQDERRAAWELAYADYVEALHHGIAQADPATFDAATLTALGQSMICAAATAAAGTAAAASASDAADGAAAAAESAARARAIADADIAL